jgi:ATP-dependent helicase Lhr and Lhr-like helicase
MDELGAAGEVVWVGAGALGMNDGWVVLADSDSAPLLLPAPSEAKLSPLASCIADLLEKRGALFFRQLSDALAGPTDRDLLVALWDLVWAGRITNDTLVPLRGLLRARPFGSADGMREQPRRRSLSQAGPASGAGRWSLAPARSTDPTRRLHAWAGQLLRRHGVLTRGAVAAESVPGGFAAVYPVLKAFEEAGTCRRGYFVEGLGGSQFALPGAVDRMRGFVSHLAAVQRATVLAAADPANPYGAALPWLERATGDNAHRPGRKAGATVVLIGGNLVLYVERGGRTILSYTNDEETLEVAVRALAEAARLGTISKLELERADGERLRSTPFSQILARAGFRRTYRGFQLRT